MMPDNYLIAVDGGGTKTVFCAQNIQDFSKTYYYSGSTNYKSIGEATARENLINGLTNIFDELCLQKEQVRGIVLGLSGCDSEKDYRIYDRMLDTLDFDKRLLYICNDSELAFHAAGNAPGIVIICGTGSIALGIDASGNKSRSGGWGSRISDLGSGYWIGAQVIQQLLLYCDGCSEYKDIFDRIKDEYHIEAYDALPLVMMRLNDYEIAAFAKTVVEYAEKGDAYSMDIIDGAVEHLSALANSVYKKLNFCNEESIDIVAAGSLFKSHFFKNKLEERLKTNDCMRNVRFFPVVTKPVDGGINIALKKYIKGNKG